MSKRLPSPSPGQGSYGQFLLDGPPTDRDMRPPPRNQRREALKRLDQCIPKSEDQWQQARQRHGYQTPEDVYRTVSLLATDGLLPADLRRLVYIAICCVDRHFGNKAKGYRDYRARVNAKELAEFTIDNYMSLVQGLMALIHGIYPKLRHRAFEAVLLYTPLSIASLGHYKQEPDNFKACFSPWKITAEEHASLALYLPFIVAYRHPEYDYDVVCEALGPRALNRDEYLKFVSVLENKKPVPYILPGPRYDPVRDEWTVVVGASNNTDRDIDVEVTK